MLSRYSTSADEDAYALEASESGKSSQGKSSQVKERRAAALAATLLEKQILSSLVATLNAQLHDYLRSQPSLLPSPAEAGVKEANVTT